MTSCANHIFLTSENLNPWCAMKMILLFIVLSEQSSLKNLFISVQSLLCLTLCSPMDYSTPGLPIHQQLLEITQIMSIESVTPSNHLILCCPLLLPPSIFPSIRVFSNENSKVLLCVSLEGEPGPLPSSVQPLSHFWLLDTPWTAAHQASLSKTNSQSLLKLMYI